MFNRDQFHDPEFHNLVRAARAVIAERVGRGIATPAERLAVAALDEMPDVKRHSKLTRMTNWTYGSVFTVA